MTPLLFPAPDQPDFLSVPAESFGPSEQGVEILVDPGVLGINWRQAEVPSCGWQMFPLDLFDGKSPTCDTFFPCESAQ